MIAELEDMAVLCGSLLRPASRRRVEPLHNAIPGRVRLAVAGLRNNAPLGQTLENRLPGTQGIRLVSANAVSGNALLLFDPTIELGKIVAAVEAVLGSDTAPADAHTDRDSGDAWHATPVPAVLEHFGTSPETGLSTALVDQQRARHGANVLPPPAERSIVAMLVDQVSSLPVMLLLGSAVISVATGGLLDAALVLSVVCANAAIGCATTLQAERMIRTLADTAPPPVQLVRDGSSEVVQAAEIVPGDLLLLHPGTIVPADARVIEGGELGADEAALTGESTIVAKDSSPVSAAAPLGERASMVHRGTTIVAGHGKAIVTATGRTTELGNIQALASAVRPPPTPMERQLGDLGRILAIGCLVACAGVFGLGLLRGYNLVAILRTSVALAVAAVPEGLPAVATVTLALGIRRMRALNVFVRRLDAIEALGAVNVICFDKTGTLTENRMSVRQIVTGARAFQLTEGGYSGMADKGDLHQLLEVAALCNDAEPAADGSDAHDGAPTECALLDAARLGGIDVPGLRASRPLRGRIDRAAARRYMSTTHATPDGGLTAVKGDPTAVLALCNRHLSGGREAELRPHDRARIAEDNDRLAAEGLRVLGFAAAAAEDATEAPNDLVWLGMAGMADPVRQGMRELMHTLHRAGVDTVMITGDQSVTAYAIAKELDLSGGRPIEILDGPNIDAMPTETLAGLAAGAHVFARVSPAHKLRIVQALQRAGKVVAMTGDGINDSPALRAADIGVAMGRTGTDAAREMADVVLADDNLATIAVAIREGRTIHRNIRKAVRFLLSSNMSEMTMMTAGVGLAAGEPLVPAQLLWLNLVTDVAPAIALGMEDAEPEAMSEPPRDATAPIFAMREAGHIAAEGALIGASSLVAHTYGLARFAAPNGGGVGFLACIMAELLHGWSSRSPDRPLMAASLPPNRHLALALGGLGGLQALAALVPATQRVLNVAPLDIAALGVVALAGTAPFLVNELLKSAWPSRGDRA
jgi:Ca2+-transporting ATPase